MKNYEFAYNKRARFDYDLLDTFTAGVVLHGHEVKSIRNGGADLKGSYITISENGEAWLTNAHVRKYAYASNLDSYDPERSRKLLLQKSEITKLQQARDNAYTLIPLSLIAAGKNIKLVFAIAKGKKAHDKRQDIKRRDIERDEGRRFAN